MTLLSRRHLSRRHLLLVAAGSGLPLLPAPALATAPGGTVTGEFAIGAGEAPVTVIEYFALTCVHCANFHKRTLPEIRRLYIDTGKVRWIFRDFPFNRPGLVAHTLARCSGQQAYLPVLELLLETREQWSTLADPVATIAGILKIQGMTRERADACLQGDEPRHTVLKQILEGETRHGINSTPSFLIDGELVAGDIPPDEFSRLLDRRLEKTGSALQRAPGSAQGWKLS